MWMLEPRLPRGTDKGERRQSHQPLNLRLAGFATILVDDALDWLEMILPNGTPPSRMILANGIPERGGVVNPVFSACFGSGWMAEGMR